MWWWLATGLCIIYFIFQDWSVDSKERRWKSEKLKLQEKIEDLHRVIEERNADIRRHEKVYNELAMRIRGRRTPTNHE